MEEITFDIKKKATFKLPEKQFMTFLGLLKKLKETPAKVGFSKADFSEEERDLIDELYQLFDWESA